MAQPRPARVLALVARTRGLELVKRQRRLDLGADPRALEADDQPAAAARDLLGDRADHAIDELALAERRVGRRLAQCGQPLPGEPGGRAPGCAQVLAAR